MDLITIIIVETGPARRQEFTAPRSVQLEEIRSGARREVCLQKELTYSGHPYPTAVITTADGDEVHLENARWVEVQLFVKKGDGITRIPNQERDKVLNEWARKTE